MKGSLAAALSLLHPCPGWIPHSPGTMMTKGAAQGNTAALVLARREAASTWINMHPHVRHMHVNPIPECHALA